MDVHAADKFIDKFESESVHVSHGQHAYQLFSGRHSEYANGEFQVSPQAAVGKHHSFGGAGCTGGIINHSQIVQIVVFVMHVFRTETVGEFFSEKSIQTGPGFSQLFFA